MKTLVVAGGLPQIELIKQLKKRNIETVLVDGSDRAIARQYADKFYQVDIFDIEAVKTIAVNEKVDILMTVCADQVLLVVAEISEDLGLPCYIDFETARKASDKTQMKRVFTEFNIPTSRYAELCSLNWDAVEKLKYPMVVKPVDAYSSKGVRKAYNREEFEKYYYEATAISRSGGVIVEEFCEGAEISVDAFVENGKAKVLCISNSEKIDDEDRFVIFRGRCPANVSPDIVRQIEKVTQQIADAFKLENSPLLIQMINDGEKVTVLEFCARTGGNMKYLLIKYSSGVDVIAATIDITLGIAPDISVKEPEHKYIVNDFIYCQNGIFDHMEGFDELVSSNIITDFHCIRLPGHVFSSVKSSSDRIAGVTIQADSLEEFNEKHRLFVNSTRVIDKEGNDIMRRDLLPDMK